MAKMTPRYNMARWYISARWKEQFFFLIPPSLNAQPTRTREKEKRDRWGRARTIADAITTFIRANVNAPRATAATGPAMRADSTHRLSNEKWSPPLRRALLSNRYCCNPLCVRCRASGSTVTPVLKNHAATNGGAARRGVIPLLHTARSHIPIIRRNLTWIVESCVKPLKKYIPVVVTDGNELRGR